MSASLFSFSLLFREPSVHSPTTASPHPPPQSDHTHHPQQPDHLNYTNYAMLAGGMQQLPHTRLHAQISHMLVSVVVAHGVGK